VGFTLDFRDFSSGDGLASIFQQTPEAAVSFFRDKGLKTSFSFDDMVAEEHVAAFTVAKMMDVDLLADVKSAIDDAIANGETPRDFRKRLMPKMQQKGWWGKADVTDPNTGATTQAQLGSAARLNNIYRSNVQAAYAQGQWQQIREQREVAPYLMYDAVDDHRTRPMHNAWDNTTLPVDDPWWDTHYPPNGFQCRCGVIQLSGDELESMGIQPSSTAPPIETVSWTNPTTGEVLQVPRGIDRGWDYHIGKARQDHLESVLQEKIDALPEPLKQAAPAVQELADKAWTKGKKVADEELANLDPDTVAAQRLKEIADNNEPHLASALKQLNKTKTGQAMSPSEKLDAVQAKAAKQKQNSDLAHYKSAKLKGKEPGPEAQAAYDALPEQAQADIDQAIDAQLAKAAEIDQAQATLDDIEANPQGQKLKAEILAKMKANGEDEGMGPVELLDEVNARYLVQQQKKQQASALSGYKKKVLAGKIPTPAQKAAFDAMDEAEQDKFLAKLDKAKADQAAAQAPESVIESPAASISAKEASDQADDLVTDVLAADLPLTPDAEADAAKALKWLIDPENFDEPQGPGLKVLKGKGPAVEDVLEEAAGIAKARGTGQAFANMADDNGVTLPDSAKAKLAASDASAESDSVPDATPEQGPPETEPAPQINTEALTKVGEQQGSNPGGTYLDTETGQKWYIKQPDSPEIARNEVLAGKLYEAAGVEVPRMEMIDLDGTRSLASQIIEGLETGGPGTDWSSIDGAHRNFVVDAWLGNWDVAGLDYDNLLIKAGRAVRVDTGGALRYRAQGSPKSASQWTGEVQEIETLRDPQINPQSAQAFANISREDMVAGARKVARITDEQIDELIENNGPADPQTAANLAATLKARRDDILERFPEAAERADVEPKPAGARVTETESKLVDDARSNGVAFRTDEDQIEDQQVLVWRQRSQDGDVFTNADLKVRRSAARQLDEQIEGAATKLPDLPEQATLETRIIEASKGLSSQALKGGLRQKDADRIATARQSYDDALAAVKQRVADGELAPESIEALRQRFEPWVDALNKAGQSPLGEVPDWAPPASMLEKGARVITKAEQPEADKPSIEWTKRTEHPWTMARFDRGFAQDTDEVQRLGDPTHYEAFLSDGRRVLYFPSSNRSTAIRNRLIIETPGDDTSAAEKTIQALDELGVNGARATDLDGEELYLTQIARHRRDGFDQFIAETEGIEDQAERVAAMQRWLSGQVGQDITKMPNYRPQGDHEAFGHGLVRRERPDLDTPEFRQFARQHRLYHENTRGDLASALDNVLKSGGKMSPNTDRLRRGIPHGGMSPDQDMETGGASYFFTRIKKRQSSSPGFYWKADHLKRLDSISYSGDEFGRVVDRDGQGDFVQKNRQVGTEEWQGAAKRPTNETIFKGGLSLFDGLDRIQTSSASERERVLQVLRDNGFNEWPDGRALEEVVK